MIRKIATLIFSVAIVVAGVIGFNKLRYWDRSKRIFVSNTAFGNRFEGWRGVPDGNMRFEGFPREAGGERRQGFENIPDSIRRRRPDSNRERFPAGADSLRRERAVGFRGNPGEFRRGGFGGRGERGGDFRRGGNVRLNNVYWFLSVFAGFVVLTIYLDKLAKFIRKKVKRSY
jgi:hypothetical protein